MTARAMLPEWERTLAAVTACERKLRQAQEEVWVAGESLRKAIRRRDSAEAELNEAERRRDRLSLPVASRRLVVQREERLTADRGGPGG